MRHPSKAQVRHVIDTLREYTTRIGEEGHPAHVDFAETTVIRDVNEEPDEDGGCRTVACFAGHYMAAVVTKEEDGWEFGSIEGRLMRTTASGERHAVWFHDGREAVARALGFESAPELCTWAHENPEAWGNTFGRLVFDPAGVLAFGGRIPSGEMMGQGSIGGQGAEGAWRDPWDPDYFNENEEADCTFSMEKVLGHLEGVHERLPG